MAMSHTIVRNQKSKLGGDKVCLRHYEFEVTKKKATTLWVIQAQNSKEKSGLWI